MTAGTYPTRCLWKQHAYAAADTFGVRADTFTDHATTPYIWARIEDRAGAVETVLEDRRATVRATIRVRNELTGLAAQDRLLDQETSQTWQVETVVRGEDEMVCECYMVDGVLR